MGLTEKGIKALEPESKRYRVSDGGGLVVEVRPSGERLFLKKYRFNKKARTETIGVFPSMKLADARARSIEISRMVKAKIDPRADMERVREIAARVAEEADVVSPSPRSVPEERRFEVVVRKFINKRIQEGIAEATIDKLNWNLAGAAAGHFQGRDIGNIEAPEIVALIEAIQADEKFEKAKDIHRKLKQTFDYAIALGLIKWNPAYHVQRAIIRRPAREHPGLTNPKDVGGLMRAIRGYPTNAGQATRAALLVSAYTALRSTELRGARWAEIDFEDALWTVPQSRMKPPFPGDHVVPLSRQALEIFERLNYGRDPGEEYVFPMPKKPGRYLSENTLQAALRRLGYDTRTEHSHHGFRKTLSTTLHEMDVNTAWIEKQLAHRDRNAVRAVYNKAQYLEQRRGMMQQYADWLDRVAEVR